MASKSSPSFDSNFYVVTNRKGEKLEQRHREQAHAQEMFAKIDFIKDVNFYSNLLGTRVRKVVFGATNKTTPILLKGTTD